MPFESYELICTTSHDLLHGMFCNCNLSFNLRLGHHNLKVLDCTLKIGVVIENINAFNMWRRPQESVEQVLMFSREVFFILLSIRFSSINIELFKNVMQLYNIKQFKIRILSFSIFALYVSNFVVTFDCVYKLL